MMCIFCCKVGKVKRMPTTSHTQPISHVKTCDLQDPQTLALLQILALGDQQIAQGRTVSVAQAANDLRSLLARRSLQS